MTEEWNNFLSANHGISVSSPEEERRKRAWNKMYSGKNPAWRGPSDVEVPFHLGNRVLELGCGNGKTLKALLSATTTVALDFSPSAVMSCNGNQEFGNVDLVIGDARELPFISESFTSVFCVHVLEHLNSHDRPLLIKEVDRVLEKGGNFFLRAFSSSDFRAGKGRIVESGTRVRGDGISIHYFDEEDLKSLLKGLKISSLKRIVIKKSYGAMDVKREFFEVSASKADHR